MNNKRLILILLVVVIVTATALIRLRTQPNSEESPAVPEEQAEVTEVPIQEIKPLPTAQDSEFIQYTEKVLRDLPTVQDLHNGQDVHMTPPEAVRGGVLLAEVREKWRMDRKLLPAAESFYRKCAVKNETLESLQALCLRNLWDIKGSQSIDVAGINPRVVELATQLPSFPIQAE